MVVLAGLVAASDFAKHVNRAFAALLAARGLGLLLPQLASTPEWSRFSVAAQPYLVLAVIPLAVHFASVYPRPRGPLARPGGGWFTLGVILALDAAYLADHSWYHSIAPGTAAAAAQAANGYVYTGFGPLAALASASSVVLAGLGLLFVHDYTRSAPGAQRATYFLVAAGFVLNGIYDGCRQAVGLGRLLEDPAGFPWFPWGWAVGVLPVLSLVPALAAVLVMAIHRFGVRDQELRLERRLYVLCALAGASGLLPLFLPAGSEFFAHPATVILLGAWRLSLAAFVTYALVRYSMFGIDARLRSAVAWGWVVALFGGTFFVVSESIEALATSQWGTVGGLLSAGLLALAARPLARAGRRVAHFVLPASIGPPPKAVAIYRDQFVLLQEDGTVTAKERASLERLRKSLGLSWKDVAEIERPVTALRATTTAPGVRGPRNLSIGPALRD